MQLVRALDLAPVPWRNGGGVTRELLAWPSPGDWRCRISVADIARDGPFSTFHGVVRHFVVLEGDGVALNLGGRQIEQRPGDAPLVFDGALAPGCRLLGGPVRDLNLMTRGGRGGLWPIEGAWQAPGRGLAGLFTRVAGVWRAGADERALPALTLFTAAPPARMADTVPWTFEPDTPIEQPGWWLSHDVSHEDLP